MVISKAANSSLISSKELPKYAVSFHNSCKFEMQAQVARCGDKSIQSTDRRRRYQRRGSKSPAMLMAGGFNPISLGKEFGDYKETAKQQRRLSLVSALRAKLEESAIVDSSVSRKPTKRITAEQQRNFTFEVLSHVQELDDSLNLF